MTFVMLIYLRVLECVSGMPTCSAMALLSHRQGWSLAVLLTLFPCLFSATETSDAPAATYRTVTSEVRVAFFATDENDRLFRTVTPDDFAVVDDGVVIRDFRSLLRASETALQIVLMIDASESVEKHFRETAEGVSKLVAGAALSSADELSVLEFRGVRSRIICDGDCKSAEAQKQIAQLQPAGATPLYDAMIDVAQNLKARQRPDVRQIVILFSDGHDTISRASAGEALGKLLEAGAVLYAVSHESADDERLEDMAEATGGRLLPWRGVDVLEEIFTEQRASYVVSYALPNHQKGFHSLRILPKHNLNLQFHCRRGYYYDEVR